MKTQSYRDTHIWMIQNTPSPNRLIQWACETTMRQVVSEDLATSDKIRRLLEYLVKAEHTSVLEHVVYTFKISGVSRSFLAQITRHRMGSFTSSSQHYQDYRDYPMVVHPDYIDEFSKTDHNLASIVDAYVTLIDRGVPNYEARQILPNACAVNLIWTVNARALLNFMRLRMCNRNTAEIKIFAQNIKALVALHWPEFSDLLVAPCVSGACNQGKMQCEEKCWKHI